MQLVPVYLNQFPCNSLLKCVSQPKIAKKSVKTPRSSNVIEFDSNREPVYDFLLMINKLCLKTTSPTVLTVTLKPIIRFDNFWYEYS